MNVFIKEDEDATIGCNASPRVKISSNTEVGGDVGCITGVEVRTDWFSAGGVIVEERGMGKDVDGDSSFTITVSYRLAKKSISMYCDVP